MWTGTVYFVMAISMMAVMQPSPVHMRSLEAGGESVQQGPLPWEKQEVKLPSGDIRRIICVLLKYIIIECQEKLQVAAFSKPRNSRGEYVQEPGEAGPCSDSFCRTAVKGTYEVEKRGSQEESNPQFYSGW
ncbi:uncharacterized protein LOC135385650 [Ornithodoros turicata]|uniref:uncharacterized protein LOC135385650 n=1 Tax=Ornithodoros turicata TaxID=34597 RepID=UPI003138F8EA